MSFAAPIFLWYFMPAVLLAYWVLPRSTRNALISVASLFFYAWGAGPYVFLLLSCIAVNYAAGLAVDSARLADRRGARKAVLVAAIVFDLGILAIWKYAGFASRQVAAIATALDLGDVSPVSLALPIGISFFTFHHLSYVIDVHRRSRPAQRSIVQFVTYIAMFPQLDRGPDRALPRDLRAARGRHAATAWPTSPSASPASRSACRRRCWSPTPSARWPTPPSPPRPAT